MTKLTKLMAAVATLAIFALPSFGFAQELDSAEATVRMQIGKFAKITGLDDFVLTTEDEDGSAGALYSGFDNFNLEANAPVQVVLTGQQLSKGENSVPTSYALDDAGMNFSTAPGVHNSSHKVSAQAQLGNISDQEAGDYAANIIITVSALIQ